MELYRLIGQVLTNLVAFLLFVIVMKKYAWGPILNLLDERQRKIQEGFEDIKKRQSAAEESQRRYEERLKGIEAEARQKIQEAVGEGQRVANEILEKARVSAGELVESSHKKIELEIATARKQLRDEVISLTLRATERLINEKLTADKDRELVGSFISDIEGKSL